MDWFKEKLLLQWSISGVLLGIGFVYPSFWFVSLIGGAYFLYLLEREQTRRSLFLGTWLAWTIKSAMAMVWLWSVYPIDWLPDELGNVQLLIIGGYWLVISICLGCGAVFFVWLAKLLKKYFPNSSISYGLLLPLFWVVGEVVGSTVFSIVSLGPGGSINSSLSFGYSGYLLAESEWLLPLAKVAGVYGLGFLFAVLSSFIFHLVRRTTDQLWKTVSVVLIIFALLGSFLKFNTANNDGHLRSLSVVVIDTYFPRSLFRSFEGSLLVSQELAGAMEVALDENPNYIILPEDSRFFNQQQPPGVVKSFFKFQYNNPSSVIVDTSRVESQGKTFLQTFIYNGGDKPVEQVQKRYLVPQGEFLSYLLIWALKALGYSDALDKVGNDLSYEVGPNTDQSRVASEIPGVLFCFESVDPLGVKTVMKERGTIPFIAHPISHSWFHESDILWNQLDIMLKVQAVWNHQYIVSAGNHVSGKVINPNGKLLNLDIVEENNMWRVSKIEFLLPTTVNNQ